MKRLSLLPLNQIFWSIALTASILIVWFLPWRFQTNDDVLMMWLVSGAYTGEPESYAVFIHPWLSWVLSSIYKVSPDINWYGAVWFLVNWASGLVLLHQVHQKEFSTEWKNFWSLFTLLISIHLGFFPQFTLIAGYAGLAGFLIILQKPKISNWGKSMAFLLLFFGLMIRWEAVALIGMGWTWSNWVFSRFSEKRVFQKILLPLSLAGLVLLGKWTYEQNYVDQDFLAFNRSRAKVIDHPVFVEKTKSGEINTGSDWYFFGRWMFEELPIGLSELKAEKKVLDKQFFTREQVGFGIVRLMKIQLTELFKSMLILALLISFMALQLSFRKKLEFLLGWLAFFLVFNHFNLSLGRVNLVFFSVLLFPILSERSIRFSPKIFSSAGLILLLFLGIHSANFLNEAKGRKLVNEEFYSLLENVASGEIVFLEGFFEYNFLNHFSQKNPVPVISQGWISRSPFQKKAFQRMGISGQSELKSYALIAFQFPEPLVFPDYMNRISRGEFTQVSILSSANLKLLQFTK
ncbi:hypothetical protein DFQ04_1420 [Algoriphagus boseongensis]|uniref:Dolichyl-phosphate-mannose-protein mannosyltransferase n=1 Tax=Algoriphagus boseongensis TaxID=1442587 RepID=A0A4R6TA18_9BACT|nr:hypothetical protein [Algoriphagus boseongensis]TDQ19596.1 hypothetical protein DFQ04_1420 [Algoriphagus boseongensis]